MGTAIHDFIRRLNARLPCIKEILAIAFAIAISVLAWWMARRADLMAGKAHDIAVHCYEIATNALATMDSAQSALTDAIARQESLAERLAANNIQVAALDEGARAVTNDLHLSVAKTSLLRAELNALESGLSAKAVEAHTLETRLIAIESRLGALSNFLLRVSQTSVDATAQYNEYQKKIAVIDQQAAARLQAPLPNGMIHVIVVFEKNYREQAQRISSDIALMGFQMKTIPVDAWDSDAVWRIREDNQKSTPTVPRRAIVVGQGAESKVAQISEAVINVLGKEDWVVKRPQGKETAYYDIMPEQVLVMIR